MTELKEQFKQSIFADIISRDRYETVFLPLAEDDEFMTECEQFVRDSYTDQPCLGDGFSRLAFLLWLSGKEERAMQLWQRDMASDRSGWWQQLRYMSAVLKRQGLAAARRIADHVHDRFPQANNVYASLAWDLRNTDTSLAGKLASKDAEAGRLTPGFRLNYACILVEQGCMQAALKEVEMAYSAEPGLKDGHCRISSEYHLPRNMIDDAVELFSRDLAAGRMSANRKLQLGMLFLKQQALPDAERLVAVAYAEDSSLRDGYSRIGWHFFRPRGFAFDALRYFRKDAELDRLSPEWTLNQGIAFATIGDLDGANEAVERAYARSRDVVNGYCRIGWEYHLPRGQVERAMDCFQRDVDLGRINGDWRDRHHVLRDMVADCDGGVYYPTVPTPCLDEDSPGPA